MEPYVGFHWFTRFPLPRSAILRISTASIRLISSASERAFSSWAGVIRPTPSHMWRMVSTSTSDPRAIESACENSPRPSRP